MSSNKSLVECDLAVLWTSYIQMKDYGQLPLALIRKGGGRVIIQNVVH